MNKSIKNALRIAQSLGRGDDTILAHINPREAALLKKRGGSGKINPRTGLIEFDEGDTKDSETKDTSSSDSSSGDNVRADSVSQSEQASADAAAAAAAASQDSSDTTGQDSSDTTGGTTDTAPKPDTTGGDTSGKAWYDKVLESVGNAFFSPTEAVNVTTPEVVGSFDPNAPASIVNTQVAKPYGTNTPLLGGGVDPSDRATAEAAKFQLASQAADAENAALNAAADASVAAGGPTVTTFGTPILQSGTFTGGGEPADVGAALRYVNQFGRNPSDGYGITDVVGKALDSTSPTGNQSIYSYTPPKGTADAIATLGGTNVPLPIARPADLGITDTSGNPIVPKATGGDSATVDVVKKAASDTGTNPDDVYRDLMNQPGWGSEDPGLIADFNKYAFEKYGLKLGPTTKSGEISVGQTTPQVMVPRVNPDGSVTMVPTLGSVINTGLEELMNPFVKIGTQAYADLGGSNVGALKTTDTTGGISGGTTDTTIKGSKDTVQPTGSGDTSGKTTPSTAFVPIVLGSTGKPLIPVEPGAYESYGAKGYGASTYQNPYLTRFLATGGSVHGNNAIANSLRFVKGNKA